MAACRRQPFKPAVRNNRTNFNSVALFPRDRTAAMIRDRSALLNVSATPASMSLAFSAGNSAR
jgi:hypothetical protein